MPSLTRQQEWHDFLSGTHPHLHHARPFRLIPSSPRCRLCAAPFLAPGSAIFKPFGFTPWEKNPNLLVELLTAYLDDKLANEQRGRLDAHLSGYQGCRATLDQFRTLIRIASRLTTADVAGLDPLIRDRLMSTLQIPHRR